MHFLKLELLLRVPLFRKVSLRQTDAFPFQTPVPRVFQLQPGQQMSRPTAHQAPPTPFEETIDFLYDDDITFLVFKATLPLLLELGISYVKYFTITYPS